MQEAEVVRERFSADKWQVFKIKKKKRRRRKEPKRWAGFPTFLHDAVLQLTAGPVGMDEAVAATAWGIRHDELR